MHPLKIKMTNELLALALLVIVLIGVIALFPSNILRIILGLPFVLFLPGYMLMAVLFPRRGSMSSIDRVALSFGMSIAVVPLIGLVLNYTPWGIRPGPVLYSLASFILILALIAFFRRNRLVGEERFRVEFTLVMPDWGTSARDRAFSVTMIIIVLGILGLVGHNIATRDTRQGFTEFYILDLEGKAIDYPGALKVGEEGKVIVVIINHEINTVSYRVEVKIDGVVSNALGPVTLENDMKWEHEVSFVPQVAGQKLKVDFLLYKDGGATPYLESLNLWVDVKG